MSTREKISPAFRAQLERCDPTDAVRAVLLLNLPKLKPEGEQSKRLTTTERRALAAEMKAGASNEQIDTFLRQHSARRVSDSVSALGTVLIEAPAESILAIESERIVRAIMADQALEPPQVITNRPE